MRIWYKFRFKKEHEKVIDNLDSLEAAVGTHIHYDLDREAFLAYLSKSSLLSAIYKILDQEVGPDSKVISIGCSNAEHEIAYLKNHPTCSDNWIMTDFDSRSLNFLSTHFQEYRNSRVDILDPEFDKNYSELIGKFDIVFVPGLLYLFDDDRANAMFRNLKSLMSNAESKIIFCFRERDHFFTKIIDNILAPVDGVFVYLFKRFIRKENGSYKRFLHGYRRTDEEFASLVLYNGLSIKKTYIDCFDLEYKSRLPFFERAGLNKVIQLIVGKSIPYLCTHVLTKNS